MGPATMGPAACHPALGSDKHCGTGSVPGHSDWVRLHCGFLSLCLSKTNLSHTHWALARSAAHAQSWLLEWPTLGGRSLRNVPAAANILRIARHIRTNRRTHSRAAWVLDHTHWLFVRRALLSRDLNVHTMAHRQV